MLLERSDGETEFIFRRLGGRVGVEPFEDAGCTALIGYLPRFQPKNCLILPIGFLSIYFQCH